MTTPAPPPGPDYTVPTSYSAPPPLVPGQYVPGQYPPPPPGYVYPPPPALSPSGYPLAEFVDRFVARLVDGLIVGAISLVFIVPVYVIMFMSVFSELEAQTAAASYTNQPVIDPFDFFLGFLGIFALVFALSFVLSYLYEVELLLRGGGQTPGKKVMKIKVVPLDSAHVLTRKMALQRYLIYVAAGFVPAGNLIDGLWQLWDKPYRQCLHDKWPQTVVIKLPS